ncbi:LysR family transcriptional regulator [Phycisphaera mikurensis]|uniref:Putative LysR family transcriptional regulator n=1 Tax=Phycisphaera mikurensis (strain NBRC 102666 / KCTC 22515 / FYK2301M01) TaxID=1142394 RepID=I0IHP3_PHYMF|nr:LysR family transcriptional regulator [Phycisphaera mikurensis]MBB6441026.1 DNA-binding transcriptional LysR family regulator [Phycisphaera mikurensis]BAM04781.1 putative LysR family transcriptional regulator [Phycisphaera mikurensis NBRC 102666]
MDDFANLRLFLDVADTRSFSRAAERHGVTQPAASQRVAQLEAKLGAKLLDRGVRPPALTEPGRRYAEGCRTLLAAHERLVEDVAASLDADAGPAVVRVAAIYSAGIAWLGGAADRHVEAVRSGAVRGAGSGPARGVRVRIDYASPQGVADAVRGGEADFGVVSFPAGFAGMRVWPLREEPMAVVCPPTHALAREASVAARHLAGHAILRFDPELPVGRATDAYFEAAGVTFTGGHRFDNLDTLKAAVADTGRFAVLPLRPCAAELEAGTLVAVALNPPLCRPIGLLFPRGKTARPEATAFAEALLAESAADREPPSPGRAAVRGRRPLPLPLPRKRPATTLA